MYIYKLQRINFLVVLDFVFMFGKVNLFFDFEDGIFIVYFRKVNKVYSVYKMIIWICLDVFLYQGWVEFLSSVLDKGEVVISLLYLEEEKV